MYNTEFTIQKFYHICGKGEIIIKTEKISKLMLEIENRHKESFCQNDATCIILN
ncbi:hypothetical protein T06_6835 [Trichinella sp. T6]|nr:hypothetical protein T06_6835 [Trichinella sp. T6]